MESYGPMDIMWHIALFMGERSVGFPADWKKLELAGPLKIDTRSRFGLQHIRTPGLVTSCLAASCCLKLNISQLHQMSAWAFWCCWDQHCSAHSWPQYCEQPDIARRPCKVWKQSIKLKTKPCLLRCSITTPVPIKEWSQPQLLTPLQNELVDRTSATSTGQLLLNLEKVIRFRQLLDLWLLLCYPHINNLIYKDWPENLKWNVTCFMRFSTNPCFHSSYYVLTKWIL
jgi:hypothetical protein